MKAHYLRHLLTLFSVSVLRQTFSVGGQSKGDVAGEVVKKKSEADILAFIKEKHGLTKQHVYIFELDGKRSEEVKTVFEGLDPESVEAVNANRTRFFYLIELKLTYIAGSPPDEGTLKVMWPVIVDLLPKRCEVYMTIMEKDAGAYLDEHTYTSKKNLEEADILRLLGDAIRNSGQSLKPLDLNKGVKHLWAQDCIDSPKATFKSPHATFTEALDGTLLLKKDDNDNYLVAIAGPLFRTVFMTLDANPFPGLWTCDPTAGSLSFARFNSDSKAVRTLVDEILRHN